MIKIVPRQTRTRQGTSRSIASSTPAKLCLGDQERSLLGQLDNHPVGVDELITRTSLTASQGDGNGDAASIDAESSGDTIPNS